MTEETGIVIQFSRKKMCLHTNLVVDDTLMQIECGTCGEKLNPFFAIRQIMRTYDKWKFQKAKAELALAAAEKKSKTKCQHCGKMTRVRVDVKDWQVIKRKEETKGDR